jgi:hypothetical protein
MNVWNKVLLGLIAVVSIVLFYFCTRALKANQVWLEAYTKHETALKNIAKQTDELVNGEQGLRQVRVQLAKITAGQGRVWPNAKLANLGQAGEVTLTTAITPPTHPGIQIFAIEDPSQQSPTGAFMGEFTVRAIQNNNVQLAPARTLTQAQLARIQQSRSTWTLYEVMPAAQADAAPADTASPSAKPAEKKAGNPETPVDYLVFFHESYRLRATMGDLISSADSDLTALKTAIQLAEQQIESVDKHVAELKTELAATKLARDNVVAHEKAVDKKLAEIHATIEATRKSNLEVASRIARIQLEATRQIDNRTKKVAQLDTRR